MPIFSWRTDPWSTFRDVHRDLSRLLGGLVRSPESQLIGGSGYPPVSIFDRDDSMLVLAEIPGVSMDSLDISITGDTLVIKGVKADDGQQDENYHRRERGTGAFSRTIVLPDSVKADAIKATLVRGILRIDLPKNESAKPMKVSVKEG